MSNHGTSYRRPRYFKKAWLALLSGTETRKQYRMLSRGLFLSGSKPRKHNAHVAMGDTSRLRQREIRQRVA